MKFTEAPVAQVKPMTTKITCFGAGNLWISLDLWFSWTNVGKMVCLGKKSENMKIAEITSAI